MDESGGFVLATSPLHNSELKKYFSRASVIASVKEEQWLQRWPQASETALSLKDGPKVSRIGTKNSE